MVNSRVKGADAERELSKLIQKETGLVFLRNLEQTRNGGHDLGCRELPAVRIEVKRQEALDIPTWWKQAVRQAGQDDFPVLAYRRSRQPWRAMMWGEVLDLKLPVDVDWVSFLTVLLVMKSKI